VLVDNLGLNRKLSQTAHVTQFIDRLMAHPILEHEGVLPRLSDLQLTLASLILTRTGISAGVRQRIIAALLLIYHGLGSHDGIVDTTEPQTQTGQLTILGGDYLSSLFYKLLADAGRIDLIQAFAQAIVQISVAKTSFLRLANNENYDEQTYMKDVETIRGALLLSLCHGVEVDEPLHGFVETAVRVSIYKDRLAERLPMRGTVAKLMQSIREYMSRLQTMTEDLFGIENWLQLEDAISPFQTSSAMTPAVEGG